MRNRVGAELAKEILQAAAETGFMVRDDNVTTPAFLTLWVMALWRQQRCCFDHRAALIFATT
jgi:hypothetical protein